MRRLDELTRTMACSGRGTEKRHAALQRVSVFDLKGPSVSHRETAVVSLSNHVPSRALSHRGLARRQRLYPIKMALAVFITA